MHAEKRSAFFMSDMLKEKVRLDDGSFCKKNRTEGAFMYIITLGVRSRSKGR